MVRHVVSCRKWPGWQAAWSTCCLLLVALSSCGIETDQPHAGIFAIDILVRSQQLAGIDLHVRYAQWTAEGLVLHLAFYNNGSTDLLLVQGADPRDARLTGVETEAPSAYSATFTEGIVPEGGWYAGGATNGALTFARASGMTFRFEFPGFPPVHFRLDAPLRAAPEPPRADPATYPYRFEIQNSRSADLVLRIEGVTVMDDALEFMIALANRGDAEIRLPAVANREVVLFDARWNQYHPTSPDSSLTGSLGMTGGVIGAAEIARAVLRFPRPVAGEVVLVRFPSFALVRVPLLPDDEVTLATVADLPPSSEPRVAATRPTAPPRSDAAEARTQAGALLAGLTEKLRTADRQGYLDLFVPAIRDEQGIIFDRLRTLPLEGMALEEHQDEDMAGVGVFEGDELRGYRATWSYRVRDVDPANAFSADVEVDFRRDGAVWRIARIGGELPFWARGPTQARRVGAFWIFFRPATGAQVPTIGSETMLAFATVQQALPERIAPVNVMFVTETAREFAALTGRDPARFLGVALSRYRLGETGVDISGAAFYINGAAFQSDLGQNRQQTITHELTHLALARETMPFTPLWAVEGMAMHVAGDLPTETMRAAYEAGDAEGWSLFEFTGKQSFDASDATGARTAIDYAYAAYLARYLIDTYGFDRFVAFYDSFAAVPLDNMRNELADAEALSEGDTAMGMLAQQLTEARVQEVFGIDLPRLEGEFKRWLGEELR